MRISRTILLLLTAYTLFPILASGQIDVPDINAAPGTSGGQNCTDTAVDCTLNNHFCWEWNYDYGSGPACANSTYPVDFPALDGKSREFDVSWNPGTMGVTNGGAIFHANLGTTNNDESDTSFSYDIWVQFTDLTYITAAEFDLNQVIADGDTIIYGTQCWFAAPYDQPVWEYATYTDGTGTGPMGSNWNPTNTDCSKWSANSWHHLVISFHRASDCTVAGACQVTYDSVYVDSGSPVAFSCGSNPCAGNGAATLGWCPTQLGCLVPQFQLDWDSTETGSMSAYGDLMTINSPQDTQVETPTFDPPGDTMTGPFR